MYIRFSSSSSSSVLLMIIKIAQRNTEKHDKTLMKMASKVQIPIGRVRTHNLYVSVALSWCSHRAGDTWFRIRFMPLWDYNVHSNIINVDHFSTAHTHTHTQRSTLNFFLPESAFCSGKRCCSAHWNWRMNVNNDIIVSWYKLKKLFTREGEKLLWCS